MASDSDKEEEFVNYGTPLEPLEEDEAPRRPVPLHEQTVLDERGRFQRFHGAFTGGFSAGYFNTVGSKEGWTPSTFVSSRQQKADKQHHARPEDFMDEEDLGEHGIAPRQITTSQEFSSGRRDAAAEKARAVGAAAALIPGDTLLEELIRPARSSVGVRLLTRMGWREGQGVGPRVKRKRRQQNPPEPESGVRVYGCSAVPAGSEESEDEDEFAPEDATFAPKDVTPVDFTPRTGRQGLGYRGLDPGLALPGFGPGLGPEPGHVDLFRPQSDSRSRLFGGRQRGSRRGGVAGQAFGVGALEDEDEDVYQRDCMSRYDRELGEEEPGDGLFGWTAPKQYKKTEGSRDASYLGKILEGFTLAQRPPEEKTVFPPPRLPRDYRPVYRGVQVSRLEGVSPALAQALRTSKGHMEEQGPPHGRHQLGSGQRGALLGEDTLTGPSSVMELLRPEDRQRLLRLRSSSSQQPPPVAPPVPDLQQEALAAWRGASSSSSSSSSSFKPFEKNPEKQQRYDLYLNRLRQGDAGALDQSLDPTMTEWERSREREEFARASILYRPSSSSLTSRFTRAKQEDEDPPEVKQDKEEVDGEAPQAAASMKMFGKLTRETLEWHPDRLLCRRFNVPDPFPGSSLVGLPKIRRDKFSIFNFLSVTDSRQEAAPPPPDSGKKSRWDVSEQMKKSKTGPDQASAEPDRASSEPDRASSEPDRASAEPAQKKEPGGPEEEQQEEQEEESRPPMDLFKAIFASSSEEKSSSSEEEEASDAEVKEEEKEEEVSLFTSPPAAPPPSRPAPPAPAASSHRPQEEQQEEFGPKLPPPNSRGGAATQEVKPSRRSKEKKHKKEKKKKKKKHKQRHKQQKKSRREESSSSQEEEQEEEEEPAGGAVSTEELLRRLKSLRSGPVQ
ncbi:G patch domain-containing protein 1 isoform 3-T3 [Menidia menidia]